MCALVESMITSVSVSSEDSHFTDMVVHYVFYTEVWKFKSVNSSFSNLIQMQIDRCHKHINTDYICNNEITRDWLGLSQMPPTPKSFGDPKKRKKKKPSRCVYV